MRIKLVVGKQTELILNAKRDLTWNQLASKLKMNPSYLALELKNEKRLLSKEAYDKLNKIARTNYDKYLLEKLDDNWGKSVGGTNSNGNTKTFQEPEENEKLAELIGIILGDGHLEYITTNKKTRAYSLTITGHSIKDFEYLSGWVTGLMRKTIRQTPRIKKVQNNNAMYLKVHGREMVKFFQRKGLKAGNKKSNNQDIPQWILDNDSYLSSCIRGLIDTDGSVHYISRNNRNMRICFTSYIPALLDDVRKSLLRFGFNPSKVIKGNQIFLTRKADIENYSRKIGFHNEKHLKRFESMKQHAPIV
ncbi:hypothetical protein J4233_05960 [Candidatus Pacearchaeota archaeon]|nr:hypothetical protein [uncultured archaeon]MBS3077780.1 hypothetical protein [Candidatus Pacearchaeota archaeon]